MLPFSPPQPHFHPHVAWPPQMSFAKPTPFLVAHRNYQAAVAAADAGEGWDVVWYGDSIVERLQGTSMGG